MSVYQTYINSMNDRIRAQFEGSNPFDFKHILSLKSVDNFEDVGPSVVMASPSGLQSGLSRQLFDLWCQDKKNACIIPGYVVEGTLAKTILNEPKDVTLMNGLQAPLNMQVHYISFSAHADFSQTNAFLNELSPPNIILVHGESNEMGRLKQKLESQYTDRKIKVSNPKNCQAVVMHFNSIKTAKTIGRLADKVPNEGGEVSGLLVRKGFTYQIMAPEDLHIFTQLSTGAITQRISIPYKGAFSVLRYRLQQLYESVEMLDDEVPTLNVHGKVMVKQEGAEYILLQWISDPISDMVSDSIITMVMNFNPESPRAKALESESSEDKEKDDFKIMKSLLISLFGDVKEEDGKLIVTMDGKLATVDHSCTEVDCQDESLKDRIKNALNRMQTSIRPIRMSSA